MTLSQRNTSTICPDHPHFTWLMSEIREAEREGLRDVMFLLNNCLAFAEACNTAWHRILEACQGDLVGVELVDSKLERYAAILPDASEPGRYRAQFYDANGFSGHATYDTLQQVLEELVRDGFRTPAPGAMQCLSQTKEWSLGTLMANLIAKVNAGKLTYRAMQDEMHAAAANLT